MDVRQVSRRTMEPAAQVRLPRGKAWVAQNWCTSQVCFLARNSSLLGGLSATLPLQRKPDNRKLRHNPGLMAIGGRFHYHSGQAAPSTCAIDTHPRLPRIIYPNLSGQPGRWPWLSRVCHGKVPLFCGTLKSDAIQRSSVAKGTHRHHP